MPLQVLLLCELNVNLTQCATSEKWIAGNLLIPNKVFILFQMFILFLIKMRHNFGNLYIEYHPS